MTLHAPTTRTFIAVAGLLLLAGCGQDTPADGITDERPGPEIAASHILVAWSGVRDCPRGLMRTREEAEHRARRIALLLRTGRGDLAEMARRYSDDPTAQRNAGYLGAFRRGELDSALAAVVDGLEVGEVGGPVATEYGWHVVRRDAVRKVRIHHILVSYHNAAQAPRNMKRDRDEARRIANALHRKVELGRADLCDLTARFSDDPENRLFCGDLGWVEPGILEPAAEQAVFSLQPGEMSAVVESDYGFHIFWRE